jgi:hypothetical protein
LVLSVLRDVKVNIIRENIFIYQELGTIITPAGLINGKLSQTLKVKLEKMNYSTVESAVINTNNVLNTTDIQALSNHAFIDLSPEAKQFLAQQIKDNSTDTIVLITQNGDQPLAFDLKCEVGKDNHYYQASIEPHLYLYKIYLINAHTLKILTWITGSPNGNLPDTHLCKPVAQLSEQDINEIKYRIINSLKTTMSADLSKLFNSQLP